MICITCGEDCSDIRGALEHKTISGHHNFLTMPAFASARHGLRRGERPVEFLRRIYTSTEQVSYPPEGSGRRTA